MTESYKIKPEEFESEYETKETIGKGTFSVVKLGINRKTKEKVAIKILEKSKLINKDDLERVEREIKILKNFNNLNIVKTNEIFQTENNHFFIMEYCENGELFNYIVEKQRLNDKESSYFYYQLINGLEYIHSKGVVHRDLKPENLLLGKGNILKIIDFGLSNYFDGKNFLSTPCGSPCYASPEMVSGNNYNGFYIDVWSTGIILYAMICGYLPFEDNDNEILFQKISKCNIEYPSIISKKAKNLMKRIIVPDPEKRIKIEEIKLHPYYLQGEDIFKRKHPEFFTSKNNIPADIGADSPLIKEELLIGQDISNNKNEAKKNNDEIINNNNISERKENEKIELNKEVEKNEINTNIKIEQNIEKRNDENIKSEKPNINLNNEYSNQNQKDHHITSQTHSTKTSSIDPAINNKKNNQKNISQRENSYNKTSMNANQELLSYQKKIQEIKKSLDELAQKTFKNDRNKKTQRATTVTNSNLKSFNDKKTQYTINQDYTNINNLLNNLRLSTEEDIINKEHDRFKKYNLNNNYISSIPNTNFYYQTTRGKSASNNSNNIKINNIDFTKSYRSNYYTNTNTNTINNHLYQPFSFLNNNNIKQGNIDFLKYSKNPKPSDHNRLNININTNNNFNVNTNNYQGNNINTFNLSTNYKIYNFNVNKKNNDIINTKAPLSNYKFLTTPTNIDRFNSNKKTYSNNFNKLSNSIDLRKSSENNNNNFLRSNKTNKNPISNYYSKNIYFNNPIEPTYFNTESNRNQFYKYNNNIVINHRNTDINTNYLRSSLDSLHTNSNNYRINNLGRSYNFSLKK